MTSAGGEEKRTTINHSRPKAASPLPPWRNADFLLLWSGQAVSTLGSNVSRLALPLLVLALTHAPAQAGLISALQTLPYLVFGLPAGALIDRWNRKRVMIFCDIARVLGYGSIPVAYAAGQLGPVMLYGVALVSGTAFVFFNIAQVAALPRVAPTAQLPQANALNASAESAATLIGPGLAGFIISLARTTLAGSALAYLVDSFSYLVSVISLGFIRAPFQAERAPVAGRSLQEEIAEGLRFLWTEPRLRTVALLTLSVNVFFGPVYLAVIVLAQGTLHADARTLGLIFSLSSVGGLAGAAVAPWLNVHLRFGQLIIGSIVLWSLATALLAIAFSPAIVVAGQAMVSLMLPIYNVAVISYRLALTPDALQGRVNSVARLLALAGLPAGTAVGGLLLGLLGPRAELWLVALGIGVSALAVSGTELRRA